MGFVDEANKALNLPEVVEDNEIVEAEVVEISKDTEDDYQTARKNIKDTIELGQVAFEELVDVAQQAQSARAYEVLFNGMRTIVDTNKSLVELSKTHEEMKQIKRNDNVPQNKTNNLVLTTKDLQKLLAKTE